MFLNEETNQTETNENEAETINDFVVTEEYSGEDTELLDIMVEHEQYMYNLSIAVMHVEHRSIVEEDTALYEQAKEGFLSRVWDQIKKFWARIVAFFKSLWDRVVNLFTNREKWVKSNTKQIDAGASKASMSMPEHFSKWDSNKEVNKLTDKVKSAGNKALSVATAAQQDANAKSGTGDTGGVIGKLRRTKNWLGEVVGVSNVEEPVNYTEKYSNVVGQLKDTSLGGVIAKAKTEAMATSKVSSAMGNLRKIEGEILALAKKVQATKGGNQVVAIKTIHRISTESATASKSLHNTIIKMCNFGWQACRKAASAANLKEGTDVTEKEEGKDMYEQERQDPTNTNASNENVNESEKKDDKDILSQYMDE